MVNQKLVISTLDRDVFLKEITQIDLMQHLQMKKYGLRYYFLFSYPGQHHDWMPSVISLGYTVSNTDTGK